jgi:4-hydroxy-3-methylbut-2-en-1-yl diphosphate reductase
VSATLQGDTQKIGKMLESAMMQKVGPAALKQHFMIMDTICDATQERQDAVYDMVGKQDQVQISIACYLVA